MPSSSGKTRVVSFHELYGTSSGKTVAVDRAIDWPSQFGAISDAPVEQLAIDGVLFGPAVAPNGRATLAVHRPISTAFMSQIHGSKVEDVLPDDPDTSRFAHSSAVAFLSFDNIIAFAAGGQASPRESNVVDFLNQHFPLDLGAKWKIRPVMDPSKLEEFNRATGVVKFSARFSTVKDFFSAEASGPLGFGDHIASVIDGDVIVELTVRAAPEVPRSGLKKFKDSVTLDLPRLVGDRNSKAKAVACFEDGSEVELNLVADHLAVKVAISDRATESGRFSELLSIVATVGAEREDEIRRAREG